MSKPLVFKQPLPSHSPSRASLKHIKDLTADSVNKAQFTIPHITPKTIEELVKLIPSHKAAGPDGLGARILKIAAPAISLPLSRLINYCIDTGAYFTTWSDVIISDLNFYGGYLEKGL